MDFNTNGRQLKSLTLQNLCFANHIPFIQSIYLVITRSAKNIPF